MTGEPSLLRLFESAGTTAIAWNGERVQRWYRRGISEDMTIRVEFLRSAKQPEQGIAFSLSQGEIDIGDRSSRVILWRNTAPSAVLMTLHPHSPDAELTVWNQWRDARGGVFASIGNQGIIVTEDETQVELRCSDGEGHPDFEDLVIRLTFSPPLIA